MRRLMLAFSLLLLSCDLDFSSSGDGTSGYAPRVFSSSPELDPQLSVDGNIEFRVEGEDEDSLNLTWTFFADDLAEETGDTGDGTFLAVWRMDWTAETSGTEVPVVFEVSDTVFTTDLNWTVTID
jgi:hypothetical protein